MSQPGDVQEREADRAAEQVLHTPEPGKNLDARKDAGLRLSRFASGTAQRSLEIPPAVSDVVSSPGEPLDTATRAFMEPRLGHELAHVRIHRDELAVASARSVNARAYTVGAHIVFGAGEYAPSGEAGKRLLAHEMTHVLQQDRSGTLAVQRREGKYPDPDAPLVYQGQTFVSPYTILKPKKLNVKGPFTAAVLDQISRWYTDVPENCSPVGHGSKKSLCIPARFGARQAELILKLLESSAEFLDIAAKLDVFYADDKNPGFRIFGAQAGMKFVPAGVPFRTTTTEKMATEGGDVIMIDESVNPRMTAADPSFTDEQVAVAFVDALVHEAVHAFRRVSKLTKGGLKGSIEEEFETRKKSAAILTEISTGSSQKVKQEAEGYIKAIQADTRSLKQVALSIVSGDEITYLESFFVDSAFRQFFEKYAKSKPDLLPGLTDFDHPSAVTPGTADVHVQKVRELIEKFSEPRDVLIDRLPSSLEESRGVEPPLQVKTLPPLLKVAESVRLLDLLDRTGSLKDLSNESNDVKKFSPAGLAVFFHILLVKTSLIKESLKQEHQNSGLDVTSKDYEEFCNGLARKFLGETKPYDQLK